MIKKTISFILAFVLILMSSSGIFSFAVTVGKVTNLRQTSTSTSSYSISWNKVSGASGYQILKYVEDTGRYYQVCKTMALSYSVYGEDSATPSTYRVRAYKGSTYGAYALIQSSTRPYTVSGLKYYGRTQRGYTAAWNAVSGCSGYQVYRFNESTGKWVFYKQLTATRLYISSADLLIKVRAYVNASVRCYGGFSRELYCQRLKANSTSGTFVFYSYGFGHGAGMSQYGANCYAKNGYNYKQILTHYYSGVTVRKDTKVPSVIKRNGVTIKTLDYVARAVQAEIGSSAESEAIKAQAVAVYSCAKFYNYSVGSNMAVLSSSVTDRVLSLVKSVFGQYISYNGKACLAVFTASNAGKTASSKTLWGSSHPYLSAVSSPYDKNYSSYVSVYKISSESLKASVYKSLSVTLSGNPASWLRITSHDSAVNSLTGYVSEIKVGSKSISGERFFSSVMNYKLRSYCFRIVYIPEK